MATGPKNKVVAFAREAGGASAIAPVCKAILDSGWDLLLLGKHHGLSVFRKNGLTCVDFPIFDVSVLDGNIHHHLGGKPNMVFTSAASLPTLDMTERLLWKWGQERQIETIGLLDQWQNYALRFSGSAASEFLAYIPDHILVMDETAKEGMVREGIPASRILITGQPAFDAIRTDIVSVSRSIGKIKERVNIHDGVVITYVAESLRRDFGDTLGYDEQSTLRFLGNVLENICAKHGDMKLHLIVKLHPENRLEEFDWVASCWGSVKKIVVTRELTPYEAIAVSDLVVGMTSIMLIESIIAGKPTVSLQINSLIESQLVATKNGSIPFIRTQTMGSKILEDLLLSSSYREQYLANQNKWCFSENSTTRCMEAIRMVLEQRSDNNA